MTPPSYLHVFETMFFHGSEGLHRQALGIGLDDHPGAGAEVVLENETVTIDFDVEGTKTTVGVFIGELRKLVVDETRFTRSLLWRASFSRCHVLFGDLVHVTHDLRAANRVQKVLEDRVALAGATTAVSAGVLAPSTEALRVFSEAVSEDLLDELGWVGAVFGNFDRKSAGSTGT